MPSLREKFKISSLKLLLNKSCRVALLNMFSASIKNLNRTNLQYLFEWFISNKNGSYIEDSFALNSILRNKNLFYLKIDLKFCLLLFICKVIIRV